MKTDRRSHRQRQGHLNGDSENHTKYSGVKGIINRPLDCNFIYKNINIVSKKTLKNLLKGTSSFRWLIIEPIHFISLPS